mgnify:CR=1 FL=1
MLFIFFAMTMSMWWGISKDNQTIPQKLTLYGGSEGQNFIPVPVKTRTTSRTTRLRLEGGSHSRFEDSSPEASLRNSISLPKNLSSRFMQLFVVKISNI